MALPFLFYRFYADCYLFKSGDYICIMIYYDIHTHRLPEVYDKNVVSIFNTYPLDYNKYKDIDNSNLYFSVGIHPWYLDDIDTQLKVLSDVLADKRIVAIGEAGLDKICGTNIDLQMSVFRKQIEMSIETNRPLIIHCVKAWDELITLYKEYKPSIPWIIHGFRGKAQLAVQLTKLGLKLSFGSKFQVSAIESIARESIFIESDEADESIISICQNIAAELDISIGEFLSFLRYNVVKTFRM